MKKIKQQLAYIWKHREAVLKVIIILFFLLLGLVFINEVIDKAL